jgi:hypothetical protein
MFQDSHMFPQVWDNAKEVNPKHFQVGITMGVGVQSVLNFWNKSASNKCSPNWPLNIKLERS